MQKKFFTEIKKTAYLWKNLWKEITTALMRAPRTADKTAAAPSDEYDDDILSRPEKS